MPNLSALADYGQLTAQREQPEKGMNPALRDRQHAAFTRALMEQYGPVGGGLLALGAIPAWQGAKAVTQALPASMGPWLDRVFPADAQPHRGTPPTWGQIGTGLAPLFEGRTPVLR